MSRVLNKINSGMERVKEAVRSTLHKDGDPSHSRTNSRRNSLDVGAVPASPNASAEPAAASTEPAEQPANTAPSPRTSLHRPTPLPPTVAVKSDVSSSTLSLGTLNEDEEGEEYDEEGAAAGPGPADFAAGGVSAGTASGAAIGLHRMTPMPGGANQPSQQSQEQRRKKKKRRPSLGALAEDGAPSQGEDEGDGGGILEEEAEDEVGDLPAAVGAMLLAPGAAAGAGSLHRPTPMPGGASGSEAGGRSLRSSSPGGSMSSLPSLSEGEDDCRGLRRLSSGSGSAKYEEHFPDDLPAPEVPVHHGPRHKHSLSAIHEDADANAQDGA